MGGSAHGILSFLAISNHTTLNPLPAGIQLIGKTGKAWEQPKITAQATTAKQATIKHTRTVLFKQASSYCWTVGNFFPMLKKTNGPWMWKPKSYQHRNSRKKLSLRNKAQNRQQQHGPSSKMHQVGNTHQESKQGLMNTAGSEVRVLVSWRLGRQCDSVILKSNCQVSGCCNSKQLYSPIRQKAFNASPLNSLRPNHRYDS